MALYPVIMCGGAGTRLWPASRPSRPKQFIPLAGNRSLFQETALRVAPLAQDDGRLIVVGGVGQGQAGGGGGLGDRRGGGEQGGGDQQSAH